MPLFNQNWIGFDGSPVTGMVPTQLIVTGPPMNTAQTGGVNHAFKLFCDAVKVTSFPGGYHVQNRTFPDGTVLRMESNAGVKRAMVRTPGAEDVENAYVYVAFQGAFDPSELNLEKSTHVFRLNVLTGNAKPIATLKDEFYSFTHLSRVGDALFTLKTFGGTNFVAERNRTAFNVLGPTTVSLPTGVSTLVPGAGVILGQNIDVGSLPYPNPMRYAQLTPDSTSVDRLFTVPSAHLIHPEVAESTPPLRELIVSNAHKNCAVVRPAGAAYPFAVYDYAEGAVESTYNPPSVYASGPVALSGKFVATVEEVNNGWLRLAVYHRGDWTQVGEYVEIPPSETWSGTLFPGPVASAAIVLDKYVVVQRGVAYGGAPYKRRSAPTTHTYRIGKNGLTRVVEFDAFTPKLPTSAKFFAYTSIEQ